MKDANERLLQRNDTTTEFVVQRNYKDTVFRMLFKEKKALLSLYNAMSGTAYENPEELEIVTLENAIYIGMKNDISFVMDFQLYLYEHQSTYNPNMPLRNLFYVAKQYEKLIDTTRLHKSKILTVPTPQFVVFYNGKESQPEKQILKLSDAFSVPTKEPELELFVTMLNVNLGRNRELMEQCKELREYAIFVEKTRRYQKELPISDALERSVRECIQEDILKEFLLSNRKEVVQMSIFAYDQEAHWKMIEEDAREEGRVEGEEHFSDLTRKLLEKDRLEDLKKAAEDSSYRKLLYQEFGL